MRGVLFHTVLRCPDKKYRMYINQWPKIYKTVCRESVDAVTFGPEIDVIKMSGAAHNFYPFLGNDGQMYAIGGIDSWKNQAQWHNVNDFEVFKQMFEKRFGEPYTKEKPSHNFALIQSAKRPKLDHSDGLYLFKSDDYINFKQISEKPIITTFHPGFNSALVWGKSTEFDGHLSCVWNKARQKYILYLRNNVRQGCRYIQWCESVDMLTWSGCKNISIRGFNVETDNYYSPVIFKNPFGKNYIGTIPYFNVNEDSSIRIITSDDGINFTVKDDWFRERIAMFKGAPKNRKHFANGIIVKGNEVNIYIYENYLGCEKRKPVQIVRYSISENNFREYFQCL